jgi:PHS family inorganic phosphate transporter-like MFS transporter
VGGDYPLSATIMSEFSNRNNRGAFVSAVFAMQALAFAHLPRQTKAIRHRPCTHRHLHRDWASSRRRPW